MTSPYPHLKAGAKRTTLYSLMLLFLKNENDFFYLKTMNINNHKMLYVALVALAFASCNGKSSETADKVGDTAIKAVPQIEVAKYKDGDMIKEGDAIVLSFSLPNEAAKPDSVVLSLNDKVIQSGQELSAKIETVGMKMGRQRIVVEAYKGGSIAAERYLSLSIKSNSKPVAYRYAVVNTFPHDTHAYTQGLVFDGNTLYEGTGQRGISDLRIVDLKSGQVQKNVPLPEQFFGEGITILNDKIYQLTWQEQRGFVYNKKTMEKVGEFSYAGEGWGITTDGKMLYQSDGTNAIRIVDPSSLTEKGRIEVYDNVGAVEYLNELEFINGELWANIYQTDKIARIDPSTGKVLGYIDFSNLLPKSDYTEGTDVLNGIAYHKSSGKIYVTGKNWPKLFEVKVTKK